MTEAIVRAEPAALEFTTEQRQMIRDTYANGASDAEFAVLMEVAKARRLNPLLRQIYFVKRWDPAKKREVWAVQTGIDGFRATAERTGKYDGQDEPEYEYDEKGKLMACTVKVYRKDWRRPAVAKAYYSEYVQKTREGAPNHMWSTMPHNQLAKCAEALALRKAFPEDLSGIYTTEEMGQADNPQLNGASRVQTWNTPGDDERQAPYASPETVASFRDDLTCAATLSDLKAAWNRFAPTPGAWEDFSPDDRKEIQKLYKKREREFEKAAKPDYHAMITACKTLDELRAVWVSIPSHEKAKNGLAIHKNNKKAILEMPDDDGGAAEAEAEVIQGQFDE